MDAEERGMDEINVYDHFADSPCTVNTQVTFLQFTHQFRIIDLNNLLGDWAHD